MSRFKYSLFIEGEHKEDYTSINKFLEKNIELFKDKDSDVIRRENYLPLIKAFHVAPFTKRIPQIYEDKERKIKIESSYIEYTGKIYKH